MKITCSNVAAEYRQAMEEDFKRHIDKLNRLLKHYEPDSVELHSSMKKVPRKPEYSFSLNLKLPTGTLHATGTAGDVPTSAKAAFAEIEVQVKKHQEKLRKDYVWKRKRGRPAPRLSELPSAD
ncbi:MAG: HPF/RaiA family ribosome-associated protein [Candidatus Acidiferrales bacterium]|jgi:ribosomal subunit interface protein